ncbi:MAG: hypothetical protein ACOX8A_10825 [Thermacetogeniaceae bacterium]|jgi:hypothetical protein
MIENHAVYCKVCGGVYESRPCERETPPYKSEHLKNCFYCNNPVFISEEKWQDVPLEHEDMIPISLMPYFIGEYIRDKYVPKESLSPELCNKRIAKDEELYSSMWNGSFQQVLSNTIAKINRPIPKCPTCGSKEIVNISFTERAASVLFLGLFSKKINKTFKCSNCNYTW